MDLKKVAAPALVVAGVALVVTCQAPGPGADADTVEVAAIHVYKTENCGCCDEWVKHLEAAGFTVTVENMLDPSSIKQRFGIPVELESCHTGLADGYVLEGHIPADVIRSFLEAAPEVVGITVPGMPIGSPGMEGANPQPYDVIAFDGKGNRTVFEHVDPR